MSIILNIPKTFMTKHLLSCKLIATNQQVCKGYDFKIYNKDNKLFPEIYNYRGKVSLLPKWLFIKTFKKPSQPSSKIIMYCFYSE